MEKKFRLVEIYQPPEKPDEFCVVAVLDTHAEAESAVARLKEAGIDLKNCSIVGREQDAEAQVIGYSFAGDRIQHWGKMGALWGGLWGLLGGSGVFLMPGIGPVLVGGAFVSAIVGALEGAVVGGGISALGAGFFNIGIPPNSIVDYETAIKGDHFVVIVQGNSEEVAKAKGLLEMFKRVEKTTWG